MTGRMRRLGVASAVVATAVTGAKASSGADSGWYARLDKPPFQPPPAAFPVAWTLLYADLTVAASSALARLGPQDRAAYARALAGNLLLNASWSWVFFRWHRLGPAVGVAAALTLSSADLARRTRAVAPGAGAALTAYPAWCAFATVLSEAIRRRNG